MRVPAQNGGYIPYRLLRHILAFEIKSKNQHIIIIKSAVPTSFPTTFQASSFCLQMCTLVGYEEEKFSFSPKSTRWASKARLFVRRKITELPTLYFTPRYLNCPPLLRGQPECSHLVSKSEWSSRNGNISNRMKRCKPRNKMHASCSVFGGWVGSCRQSLVTGLLDH